MHSNDEQRGISDSEALKQFRDYINSRGQNEWFHKHKTLLVTRDRGGLDRYVSPIDPLLSLFTSKRDRKSSIKDFNDDVLIDEFDVRDAKRRINTYFEEHGMSDQTRAFILGHAEKDQQDRKFNVKMRSLMYKASGALLFCLGIALVPLAFILTPGAPLASILLILLASSMISLGGGWLYYSGHLELSNPKDKFVDVNCHAAKLLHDELIQNSKAKKIEEKSANLNTQMNTVGRNTRKNDGIISQSKELGAKKETVFSKDASVDESNKYKKKK